MTRVLSVGFVLLAWCGVLVADQGTAAPSAAVYFDLPYTNPPDRAHRLDVYAPDGAKDRPVVVWVHGGSWVRGDKSFAQHKPQAFVEKGFVFVPINYRFVPKVKAADQTADVAAAIKYVHDHCGKWGGDPTKLIVMGHSAGTHLSALVCTDGRYLKANGLSLSNITACVAVDVAGYDIPTRYKKSGPGLKKTLAEIFGQDPESRKLASPIEHVAKDKGIPPFLVIHIGADPQKSQSIAFVKKLTEAGVSAQIHSAGGKGHKKLDEELGLPDDEPTKAVFKFLRSQLSK